MCYRRSDTTRLLENLASMTESFSSLACGTPVRSPVIRTGLGSRLLDVVRKDTSTARPASHVPEGFALSRNCGRRVATLTSAPSTDAWWRQSIPPFTCPNPAALVEGLRMRRVQAVRPPLTSTSWLLDRFCERFRSLRTGRSRRSRRDDQRRMVIFFRSPRNPCG